jgi:sterol desaturase/sphingolipid hydroxylase (fatty acid hydroxylase superfamily)
MPWDWVADQYRALLDTIFEGLVQPALFALGWMDWAEDAFDWTDFALMGVLQIALVVAICRPLEAWRPVERWDDRSGVRTDIVYTVIARLGVLPLLAFVVLFPLRAWVDRLLVGNGLVAPTLDAMIPPLREAPVLAFLVYLVVLDFGEYWRHRLQHRIGWWWALHSVHHAQTQMTFWTDDRNHILDDVLAALWFGAIALLIGVPPGQFPLLVALMRVAESLSHANVRLSYGRIGERLLVSPRFHRAHHGVLSVADRGSNYAVLLPVWDWVFGTADFRRDVYPRTGDPEAPQALATGGWLRQQAVGLKRMAGAMFGRGAA